MGLIPDYQNWSIQVDYQKKKKEIEKIETVDIEQSEIDLATMQGKNIEELRRERLKAEKNRLLKELDEQFGVVDKQEKSKKVVSFQNDEGKDQKKKLWEILQGKGLVKNGL